MPLIFLSTRSSQLQHILKRSRPGFNFCSADSNYGSRQGYPCTACFTKEGHWVVTYWSDKHSMDKMYGNHPWHVSTSTLLWWSFPSKRSFIERHRYLLTLDELLNLPGRFWRDRVTVGSNLLQIVIKLFFFARQFEHVQSVDRVVLQVLQDVDLCKLI